MERTFLNARQHSLTVEQRKEALKRADRIVEFKDSNPKLFNSIANCPSELGKLYHLVVLFFNYIEMNEITYTHLPIGSPAFNALLFNYRSMDKGIVNITYVVFAKNEGKIVTNFLVNG